MARAATAATAMTAAAPASKGARRRSVRRVRRVSSQRWAGGLGADLLGTREVGGGCSGVEGCGAAPGEGQVAVRGLHQLVLELKRSQE